MSVAWGTDDGGQDPANGRAAGEAVGGPRPGFRRLGRTWSLIGCQGQGDGTGLWVRSDRLSESGACEHLWSPSVALTSTALALSIQTDVYFEFPAQHPSTLHCLPRPVLYTPPLCCSMFIFTYKEQCGISEKSKITGSGCTWLITSVPYLCDSAQVTRLPGASVLSCVKPKEWILSHRVLVKTKCQKYDRL